MANEVRPLEPKDDDITAEDDTAYVDEQKNDNGGNQTPEVVVRIPVTGPHPTSEVLRGLAEPIRAALQQHLRSITQPMLDRFPVIQLPKIEFPALPALEGQLTRGFFADMPSVLPNIEFPFLEALQGQLTRVFGEIDFDAIKRAMERGCPPNWGGVEVDRSLSALVEITEAGLPTAWVPRASVLQELIAAKDAHRPAVFGRHRQEVIEDCRAVLAEVTSTALAEYVEALDEALDVAKVEKLRATQALAGSVFDTILRHTIKPARISGYYKRVKTEISARHENASIAELRWGLVHVPAVIALNMFDPSKGDPIPKNFNRHACAHAVGRAQYTPANAVIALAITASMIREAHQQIIDTAEAAA